MRDTIIIHCSATRAGQDFTAADIDRWHRQRGFRSIGYHFVIRLDGTIEPGRDVASTERIVRDGIIGLSVSATLADWTRTVGLPTHERKRSVKHLSGW